MARWEHAHRRGTPGYQVAVTVFVTVRDEDAWDQRDANDGAVAAVEQALRVGDLTIAAEHQSPPTRHVLVHKVTVCDGDVHSGQKSIVSEKDAT